MKDRFPIIPKELLNYRVSGRKLFPKMIEYEEEVKELFEIWKNSVGKKLKEIKEKFQEYENSSNYKKVRGYFYILSKISVFRKYFDDAEKVREFVFGLGPALSREERENIIDKLQKVYGIRFSSDIMWGDLEENSVLENFPDISCEETIKIYNLALLCGFGLISHKVKFRTSNIGEILRFAKKLGLMYDTDENGWIYLFGPESLLSESQKYGLSLSKCLYKIMSQKESKVILETKKGILEIPETKLIPRFDIEEKFDSSFEEEIYKVLKDAIPYADIQRESEIFASSSGIFIPDFKIKTNRSELFLEVVGFWTKEYIEKKVKKISEFKRDIVLIASEDNALEISKNLPDIKNLIVFRKKIPHLEIIKKIKEFMTFEEEEKTDQNILKELSEVLKDGMDIQQAEKIIKEKGLNISKTLKELGFEIVLESLIPKKGKIKKLHTFSEKQQ